MNCQEARRLIDQGVVPRSYPSTNAQLGFHLAKCADCRLYREHRDDLLARLLLEQKPPSTSSENAEPQGVSPSQQQKGFVFQNLLSLQATRMLWIFSLVLLIGISLGGVIWLTTVLVRAHQNVSAMIIPTSTVIVHNVADMPTATPSMTPTPVATSEGSLVLLSPLQHTDSITPTPNTIPIEPWVGHPSESRAAPSGHATPVTTRLAEVVPTPWPTIQSLLPTPTDTPIPLPVPAENTGAGTLTQAPPAGEATTILLLGNDRRPGETGVPRTDTLMLVRADPQQGRIALLSLPRDLWVEIPGYGSNRINAAYVWGEIYDAQGGGLGLASRTVNNLFTIPVDYVMMADFQGFIGLIDTLGGITVNVEKELYDPSFPTMDYGYMVAHFQPGPQHMDGSTALIYSRIRHPDSDFMRNLRQQAVVIGIANRLHERGDLQNIASLDKITHALRGYVQTDMPEERIVGLVWALRNKPVEQIEQYSITSNDVLWGVSGDPYALVAPQAVLDDLRAKFLGTSPRPEP